MPGLSFLCNFKSHWHQEDSRIFASLDPMVHDEGYTREILLKEDGFFLTCTKYKEYPLARFENDRFLIYLEGKIYGKDDAVIRKELETVAEQLLHPSPRKNDITSWLLNTDGEFWIFIFDKTSKTICFLNDALGRLPVYYRKTADGVRISREFGFFVNVENGTKIDRMGIAQSLLFGYPLGARTLLDGVQRLRPSAVIKIKTDRSEVEITQLHSFNFEAKEHSSKTIEQNTSELIALLSEACINRASSRYSSTGKNILGLSGGMDSRTVAASLQANNIPFVAVTRLDYLKNSNLDARIAEQLARALKIEWKLVCLEATTGRDLVKLLRMKNGLNYLGMAFILPFFARVMNDYGRGNSYFTGDGGDKVLRDLRPCWKLKSLDALVKYIFSRNQVFPLEKVTALTKISADDIVAEVKNHVSSFPENDWSQKYVHFLFSERAFKYLFEGEDRNRCFFWSVSPFFSMKFFRYALKCPDQQKEKFALHRNLLMALSPVACSITYANWKAPISGNRYLRYLFIRSILDRIPPSLKKRVRTLTQHRAYDNHDFCLQDQLLNSSPLSEYMDGCVLGAIAGCCSRSEIQSLLTVTSAIEGFEGGQTTLLKYYDAQFA